MTPAETAATLRHFNDWRRGDEDIPQFDPREIGEAIDAAVEMIERLEEAESDALEQARLNGMGSEREAALMARLEAAEKERDAAELMSLALRAKITEMERQEPVRWGCTVLQADGSWKEEIGIEEPPKDYFSIRNAFPLYALPGAKVGEPAPSVPDVDALAQFIREIDGKHQLGAGALAERIVEWLAAATEAKPCP